MNELQVIDLDDNNIGSFADNMPNAGKTFVAFLAPWCGHCNNFKSEWEETKQHLNTLRDKASGQIVTVDDNLMKRLPCKQPDGFPTLSLYEGKDWKEDYKGARSKDELVEYLLNNMTKTTTKKHKKAKTHKRHRSHGRRRGRGHNRKKSAKSLQWGGRRTKKQKYKCRKSRTMRRKRRR